MNPDAAAPRLIRWAALFLFVLLPILSVAGIALNVVRAGETEDLIARQQHLITQIDARLARLTGEGRTVADTSVRLNPVILSRVWKLR